MHKAVVKALILKMRVCIVLSFLFTLLSSFLLQRAISIELASLPPRGWNSYDSFCWTISEEEFLQNAELVSKRLRSHGYEYVVVDYLWYRRKVEGAYVDSLGFDVIDEWGRMMPDPSRWPSSRDGKGFTEVAKRVHEMGLKFGIHVMRGISTQAFNANTRILDIHTGRAYVDSGREWRAKDVGIKERACAWMKNGFMSVDTKTGAGRAFLRSLYQQYADWGVDFVKNDCVFGDDLDLPEISYVSEVLTQLNRPILYSLSPGSSATPAMARDVNSLVNMYRVTGDDWDSWHDVASHFDVARDFAAANMIGANGLRGKSWPDLDMLPFGWLTNQGTNEGPHRQCSLSQDEQKTQMTLWSMAKSPLMFGGDMRHLDEFTFNLITNPTLLEINSFSTNNREFPHITSHLRRHGGTRRSRDQLNNGVSDFHVMGLTSCKDDKVRGWSTRILNEDLEQVCWKEKFSEMRAPFCLYKKPHLLSSDEGVRYNDRFDRKVHLFATERTEVCLGASPHKKLTSKEFRRGEFLPCRRDANQMWELDGNGTLTNRYSGLCASMKRVKANPPSGARAWIATGRRGEAYVAFFNLNSGNTVISMKIADLAKALPRRRLAAASCKCREEWSGRDFGVVKESLSIELVSHGSALFVLNCN